VNVITSYGHTAPCLIRWRCSVRSIPSRRWLRQPGLADPRVSADVILASSLRCTSMKGAAGGLRAPAGPTQAHSRCRASLEGVVHSPTTRPLGGARALGNLPRILA